MEFSCILGVVAGLAGIIYFYIRRVYSYWERQGVPYLTPTFPFGNGAELGKTMSLSEVVQKFYNEFKGKGKFGGIYLSLRPEALLVDLDLIKSVTIKDFDNFCNKVMNYRLVCNEI
jgi:cytochrome P450 family 6